jgi:Domain of unknown function (DUF397)
MATQNVVPNDFYKSTFSESGGCVEVAETDTAFLVRDSKDRSGPVLAFNRHEWLAFLEGVRAGEFDPSVLG